MAVTPEGAKLKTPFLTMIQNTQLYPLLGVLYYSLDTLVNGRPNNQSYLMVAAHAGRLHNSDVRVEYPEVLSQSGVLYKPGESRKSTTDDESQAPSINNTTLIAFEDFGSLRNTMAPFGSVLELSMKNTRAFVTRDEYFLKIDKRIPHWGRRCSSKSQDLLNIHCAVYILYWKLFHIVNTGRQG